jgi:hypothetical protein
MKIHFFGAARTTTGSMYLLEVNGKKLLLECGLFQGHRDEATERNRTFPFDPKTPSSLATHTPITSGICRTCARTVMTATSFAPSPRAIWPP